MRADRWTSILLHVAGATFITMTLVLGASFIIGQDFTTPQGIMLYVIIAVVIEMRDRLRELNSRLKGAGFKLTDED